MLKSTVITIAIICVSIFLKNKNKRNRSKLENVRKEEFVRRNLK